MKTTICFPHCTSISASHDSMEICLHLSNNDQIDIRALSTIDTCYLDSIQIEIAIGQACKNELSDFIRYTYDN